MDQSARFQRVLIANRGEIALRAIRVCRRLGLDTVAVHSTADSASPHVWAADRSVCIGPPAANHSYLSTNAMVHAAQATGCGAIYPGYGFLAENAGFAECCTENDIKFIGPDAATIRTMGDKSRARQTAEELEVPVVPGSESAFTEIEAARDEAEGVGYPLLLKARSGGGGRGMRVVTRKEDFDAAFVQAKREAESSFNDGSLYLERFFERVRHIEVQVLGDGSGGAIVFDERDCSLQRRHQKLLEESPSPVVNEKLRKRLLDAAGKLTRGINYEGAGTIEFILDPTSGEFYFIEMNTRIQVEHPVTEMRAGLDLIEAQIRIALGEGLDTMDYNVEQTGHAMEFRINAENWRQDFRPAPGMIDGWRVPRGDGVRLDTAAGLGLRISPYYDSMIAKLIIYGRSRDEVLDRARAALAGFHCGGIDTTIDFHRMMIEQAAFIENRIHTRWLETEFPGDESESDA